MSTNPPIKLLSFLIVFFLVFCMSLLNIDTPSAFAASDIDTLDLVYDPPNHQMTFSWDLDDDYTGKCYILSTVYIYTGDTDGYYFFGKDLTPVFTYSQDELNTGLYNNEIACDDSFTIDYNNLKGSLTSDEGLPEDMMDLQITVEILNDSNAEQIGFFEIKYSEVIQIQPQICFQGELPLEKLIYDDRNYRTLERYDNLCYYSNFYDSFLGIFPLNPVSNADTVTIDYDPFTHQVTPNWNLDYPGECYMASWVFLYDGKDINVNSYVFGGTDITPIADFDWSEVNTGYYDNKIACESSYSFNLADLEIINPFSRIEILTTIYPDDPTLQELHTIVFSYSETMDLPDGCVTLSDNSEYIIYDVNGRTLHEWYDSNCNISDEKYEGIIPLFPTTVNWQNIVGLSIIGNTLTKIVDGNNWGNAGASSIQYLPLDTDGYVTSVVGDDINKNRMFGLSHGDSSQFHDDIDFSILLNNNGMARILENGIFTPNGGVSYKEGDILKVGVEDGVVKYYKNDSSFYTSTKKPVYPLLVDTALEFIGATLKDVQIGGGNWVVSDYTPPPPFDTTPPTFSSATLNEETGVFTITFDEPINIFAIDPTKIHIRETGSSTGGVTLSLSEFGSITRVHTVPFTLTEENRQEVIALTTPKLDIDESAVQDRSSNPILDSFDNIIVITDIVNDEISDEISGRVYLDNNANGIFDGTDTGIDGYELFAINVQTLEVTILTTSSDGTYSINVIPDQTYSTNVTPDPTITLMNSNFFPEGTVQAGKFDFFKYIENPTRDNPFTFDLAFIPVAEEDFVSLNITVYHDDNGNGIKDVEENVFPQVDIRVYTYTIGGVFVTTDANGKASKNDLVPADFVAQVFPPVGFVATSPIDSISGVPGVLIADDPLAASVYNLEIGLVPLQ